MQSRTWVVLLLSLLQMPGCAAVEKISRDELSKSHPNCKLYGHFYAPQAIFVRQPKSAEFIKKADHGILRMQNNFVFGQRIKVIPRACKSFSDLKDVEEFIHGKSKSLSGVDLDF